jgi:hypothetical protein
MPNPALRTEFRWTPPSQPTTGRNARIALAQTTRRIKPNAAPD